MRPSRSHNSSTLHFVIGLLAASPLVTACHGRPEARRLCAHLFSFEDAPRRDHRFGEQRRGCIDFYDVVISTAEAIDQDATSEWVSCTQDASNDADAFECERIHWEIVLRTRNALIDRYAEGVGEPVCNAIFSVASDGEPELESWASSSDCPYAVGYRIEAELLPTLDSRTHSAWVLSLERCVERGAQESSLASIVGCREAFMAGSERH